MAPVAQEPRQPVEPTPTRRTSGEPPSSTPKRPSRSPTCAFFSLSQPCECPRGSKPSVAALTKDFRSPRKAKPTHARPTNSERESCGSSWVSGRNVCMEFGAFLVSARAKSGCTCSESMLRGSCREFPSLWCMCVQVRQERLDECGQNAVAMPLVWGLNDATPRRSSMKRDLDPATAGFALRAG